MSMNVRDFHFYIFIPSFSLPDESVPDPYADSDSDSGDGVKNVLSDLLDVGECDIPFVCGTIAVFAV